MCFDQHCLVRLREDAVEEIASISHRPGSSIDRSRPPDKMNLGDLGFSRNNVLSVLGLSPGSVVGAGRLLGASR